MNTMMTILLLSFPALLPQSGWAQTDSKMASEDHAIPRIEHEVHVGSLLGQNGPEPGRGVSVEYIGTYRINRYLGFGAAMGAFTFNHNRISSYFPLSAVAKCYLSNSSPMTPFLLSSLGYGLALDQRGEERSTLDNKGGLSARGAIGVEFDIGKELGVMLSAGYQYQEAAPTYTTNQWWGAPFEETQYLKYRRIHLQFGIKF